MRSKKKTSGRPKNITVSIVREPEGGVMKAMLPPEFSVFDGFEVTGDPKPSAEQVSESARRLVEGKAIGAGILIGKQADERGVLCSFSLNHEFESFLTAGEKHGKKKVPCMLITRNALTVSQHRREEPGRRMAAVVPLRDV